jgi:hypothetical protein
VHADNNNDKKKVSRHEDRSLKRDVIHQKKTRGVTPHFVHTLGQLMLPQYTNGTTVRLLADYTGNNTCIQYKKLLHHSSGLTVIRTRCGTSLENVRYFKNKK